MLLRTLGSGKCSTTPRQPRVALDLEYLEEAVVEAATAAEWYATRSATAAAGFEAELAEAESAIHMLPSAWPPYDHGTRRYLLRRYPCEVAGPQQARTLDGVAANPRDHRGAACCGSHSV
jgi:hypothetical protein